MPIIIVQTGIVTEELRTSLGKDIIDIMVKHDFDARSCAVIFQAQGACAYTVDTGYIPPEATSPLRFAGSRPRNGSAASYNKADLTGKVMQVMKERKNTSMVDMSYALNISAEEWAGRALREIFTDLEQQGLITKVGEKRGTRYVYTEPKSDGEEMVHE